MNKYIYFHVCCINNWKSVVGNIFIKIKDSGLYEDISEIRCSVIGDVDEFLNLYLSIFDDDQKIKVLFNSNDPKLMESNFIADRDPVHNEQIILNHLYNDSLTSDFFVLYIHSKGVKRVRNRPELNGNLINLFKTSLLRNSGFEEFLVQKHNHIVDCIEDWVDYLLHFNLYRKEDVYRYLEEYDTVGINLLHFKNSSKTHPNGYCYSGNFWWSKSSYIRSLSKTLENLYCGPEWWITQKPGRFVSLYHSFVDHYKDRYTSSNYEKSGTKVLIGTKDIQQFHKDLEVLNEHR